MLRKMLMCFMLFIIVIYGAHRTVLYFVHNVLLKKEVSFDESLANISPFSDDLKGKGVRDFSDNSAFRPMQEIQAFDDDAKNWSTMFGAYHSGLTVFDANQDGLPDVYFCQDGRNWARPTNENAVLADEPRYQHNGLYLNQGNDGLGHPVFLQVKELVKKNNTFVKEELLVENYLFPREKSSDSEKKWARQAIVAVAADFNGDGLPDLLVGNAPPGMWWSHPETQSIFPPFVSPIGRESRHMKQLVSGLGLAFIHHDVRDNTEDQRASSRGMEYFGANSLFLNLGDQDQDGIPEWKDVSREAGLEGKRNTFSFAVADVDLDGDLDIYEANLADFDFWPGGAKDWAGARNQLYINQIAETGDFKFVEKSMEMGVAGLYDKSNPMPDRFKLRRISWLPPEYSLLFFKIIPYKQKLLTINNQTGESSQNSWASYFQDANDDGYPDLWVANDFADMDLYINQKGESFQRKGKSRYETNGNWMSLSAADFNGDLKEDLFVGNSGANWIASSFTNVDPFLLFDPRLGEAITFSMFINGYHDVRHRFIDGADNESKFKNVVQHSRVLPPDTALPNNIHRLKSPTGYEMDFDRHSIDSFGFIFGTTSFDLQNDGAMDLYFAGNFTGRGGGVFGLEATGPGRLLVNYTDSPQTLKLADLTAEHHVFNIQELKYDRLEEEGYIYRKSPLQNWRKRDMVYSYDRSTWISQGIISQEKITNQDLIQTAENGHCTLAADLTEDGFEDLIIRNGGGYDSRSSKTKNLKGRTTTGKIAVISSHDNNYPVLTNFEPGSSRVFINTYKENNWIKLKLMDDSEGSYNRDAIGAKVIVNERLLKIKKAAQGSHIANKLTNLNFGLGKESVQKIRIQWPDKDRSVSQLTTNSYKNGTLTISKTKGEVQWTPLEKTGVVE